MSNVSEQIGITSERRGGDSKDVCAILDATRIALDAAHYLTVPVSRSSKQTKGQQKAKAESAGAKPNRTKMDYNGRA